MCVLRIVGEMLDAVSLAAILTDAGLKAFVHRSQHQVTVPISEGSWSEPMGQFSDAESFLVDRGALVREVAGRPDVEGLTLDFPTERKSEASAQFFRFPASLVSKAGALGVGLELSSYEVTGHERPAV